MVSIFGLKIGGEKKKSVKGLQISAPQPQNDDARNPVDDDLDLEYGPVPPFAPTIQPLSRRNSAKSTMSKRGKLRGLKITAPFASNKFSSSLVDLPKPPGLKHHASNPSLGRRWKGDSSTSLSFAPPPAFHSLARPSTSDGRRNKWGSPADVPLTRASSNTTSRSPLSPGLPTPDDGLLSSPTSATTPKSPLGQYELKLDLPSDVSTFADFGDFTELVQTPAPLRIKKQPSMRLTADTQSMDQSDRKPPSPPQSIKDKDATPSPLPELPKLSEIPARRGSNHSNSVPSGLGELQNAISNFGPTSLPSPSTTPRASEDEAPATATAPRPASPPTGNRKPQPVIQNVRAKRDTLTVNPQRRRSLQMKIEAAGGSLVPSLLQADLSKTSNGGRSLPRPPPLNLNTNFGLNGADRDGPRSAPSLPNPARSLTPTGINAPVRSQTVVQGRPTRSVLSNESRELDPEPYSPASSSVYDDDEYPASPDSPGPLIPLTGPLASPRFPPSSHFSFSESGSFILPGKEDRNSNRSLSPITPLVPPRSAKRNQPTPDSACWPLPSPIVTSADRAAISPSPADSRLRSESESSSAYEPLAPPRIPSARPGAESPTMRSFSRPWTPTVAANEFTASPLRRAETAGPLLGSEGEIGGGLRPPPRSATVKTPKTEPGAFKSPSARTGAGTGELAGGFI